MEVKYDKIGTGYNLTRKADKYLTEQLIRHLQPIKNGKYLDIGCGTGNYTIELYKKGLQIIGVDPSKRMLENAKIRNRNIDWKIGAAEKTGISENSVEGIICFLTIHHWNDLSAGFSELSRVLKPNSRVVIFTSSPKQMEGYWLNHYFPNMLSESILQMPTMKIIEKAMKDSGINLLKSMKYSVRPDLQDQFLYCGKQNPELYFNNKVRHGISSFSSLANKTEVERGLTQLRVDIDSGEINNIIRSFENDFGDYLFVIGQKSAGSNE